MQTSRTSDTHDAKGGVGYYVKRARGVVKEIETTTAWTLRFRSRHMNAAFAIHYNRFVLHKVRKTTQLFVTFESIFALLHISGFEFDRLVTAAVIRGVDAGGPLTPRLLATLLWAVILAVSGVLYTSTFTRWFRRNVQSTVATALITKVVALELWLYFVLSSVRMDPDEALLGPPAPVVAVEAYGTLLVTAALHFSGLRFFAGLSVAIISVSLSVIIGFITGQAHMLWSRTLSHLLLLASIAHSAWSNERNVQHEFAIRVAVARDRDSADSVMTRMLPRPIVRQLRKGFAAYHLKAQLYDDVSCMFCKIDQFENLVLTLGAERIITILHDCYAALDALIAHFPKVEKIEAAGDTYIAVSGCPDPDDLHVEHLTQYALAIVQYSAVDSRFILPNNLGRIRFKIGIHSGPAAGGIVGETGPAMFKLFADTINVASRMCMYSAPSHVHLSEKAFRVAESMPGIVCGTPRELDVKGKGLMICRFVYSEHTCQLISRDMHASLHLREAAAAAHTRALADSQAMGADSVTSDATASVAATTSLSLRQRLFRSRSAASASMEKLQKSFSPTRQPPTPLPTTAMAPLELATFSASTSRSSTSQTVASAPETPFVGVRAVAAVMERVARLGNPLPVTGDDADSTTPEDGDSGAVTQKIEVHDEDVTEVLAADTLEFRTTEDEVDFLRHDSKHARTSNIVGVLLLGLLVANEVARPAWVLAAGSKLPAIIIATCILLSCLVYLLGIYAVGSRNTRNLWLLTVLFPLTVGAQVAAILIDAWMARLFSRVHVVLAIFSMSSIAFGHRLTLRYSKPLMNTTALIGILGVVWLSKDFGAMVLDIGAILLILYQCRTANRMRERGARSTYAMVGVLYREQQRYRFILENSFPHHIVERLLGGETYIKETYPAVSVLFADIKNFTVLSSRMSPKKLFALLSLMYRAFDFAVNSTQCAKLDTIGDCLVVAAGMRGTSENHAQAVMTCGVIMLMQLKALKRRFPVLHDVDFRIGIHTGPVVAAVVDARKPRYLVFSETVLIANKMESSGMAGRVLVSSETWKAMGKTPFRPDASSRQDGLIVSVGSGKTARKYRAYFIHA